MSVGLAVKVFGNIRKDEMGWRQDAVVGVVYEEQSQRLVVSKYRTRLSLKLLEANL